MEKSRSVSTILVFFGLDPAPPSFRHARPRVRRPSGLDSSVLGPPTPLYLTYFGKALGRRKEGTFTLAVCEKKHAEIDGILVGEGNIFLSGSTSAALGKCNVTLFWVKSHYRKRRHTKKKPRYRLTKGAGQCFIFWNGMCGKVTGRVRSPSRPVT